MKDIISRYSKDANKDRQKPLYRIKRLPSSTQPNKLLFNFRLVESETLSLSDSLLPQGSTTWMIA